MENRRHQLEQGKARGISAAARSHVGKVRAANQDTFVCDPEMGMFAVIDGMGGAKAGEVAAQMTRSALLESAGTKEDLRLPLNRANQNIHRRSSQNSEEQGMGCVATVTRVEGPDLVLAHVGDTRAFLASAAGCEQLTRDHTVVADIQEQQGLTDKMAAEVPGQHQVTRDIGGRHYPDLEWIDTATVRFEVEDVLMLCSDGLTDLVGDEEIFQFLNRARRKREDMQDLVNRLIEMALTRGGKDNVTVVAVRRDKAPGEKPSWFKKAGQKVTKPPKATTPPDPVQKSSHRPAAPAPDTEKIETASGAKVRSWKVSEGITRGVSLLLVGLLAFVAGWMLRPWWPGIAAFLYGEGAPGVVRVLNGGGEVVHAAAAGLDGPLTRSGLVGAVRPLEVRQDRTATQVMDGVNVTLHGLLLNFPDRPVDWEIRIGAGSQLVLQQVSIRENLLKVEVVFEDETGSLILRDSHLEVARFRARGPEGSRVVVIEGALRTRSGDGLPEVEGTELVTSTPLATSDTSD